MSAVAIEREKMNCHKKLVSLITLYLLIALSGVLPPQSARATQGQSVIEGNVRFTVLSPSLVRMEYSPTANFIDAPSVSVINRDWPKVPFNSEKHDKWLELTTEKMGVRYLPDSGPFNASNLMVSWKDKGGQHIWKPGDVDDGNLLGVPGDMAGLKTPPTTPGPLSRNGYFLLDDSHSALFNAKTDWVQPRPEKENQDWYFLVYGHEYD